MEGHVVTLSNFCRFSLRWTCIVSAAWCGGSQYCKNQAPLLRQATDLFLSIGDHALAFVEKQGIDVNKFIGPEKPWHKMMIYSSR